MLHTNPVRSSVKLKVVDEYDTLSIHLARRADLTVGKYKVFISLFQRLFIANKHDW
jgi:hypothetical protein